MNIELLRSTFERVRPVADEAAKNFYGHMFKVYPQVKPLFADTDFTEQRQKLIASVVTLADKPDELGPVLEQMGRSHQGYGVEPHQYAYVSASMMATLADALGDDWTPEVASTWSNALALVSERMIEAQAACSA